MRFVKPLAGIVVVLLAAGGVATATTGDGGPSGGGAAKGVVITAEAARRTLTDDVTVKGTLGRHEQRKVNALSEGSVTAVRVEDGATVQAGQAILAVDGRDAVAEPGELPFFRSLDVGSQGEDVRQLKAILRGAGLDPGTPDTLYTETTRAALAQWQADHGYPGAAVQRDQALTVTLGQGTGYKIGPNSAAGIVIRPGVPLVPRTPIRMETIGSPVIFHPLATPTITIRSLDSVATEGGTANFELDASEAPVSALNVNLAFAGADSSRYAPPIPSFTFPAGALSAKVAVPLRQDDLVQADQLLTATVIAGTGYVTDATNSGTIKIVSDDVPEVNLSGGQTVPQGGSVTVNVVLDQAPVRDTQVVLTFTGDAVAGKDYRAVSPVLLFSPGQNVAFVTLQTLTDQTIRPDKRLVVSTAAGSGYRVGRSSSAVITIAGDIGNAALPTVTLRGNATRLTKGQPLTLTVGLDRPMTQELPIDLAYAGDAVAGTNYQPAGRVVVPAGSSSLSVPITTVTNGLVEPDRTLIVALNKSDRYVVGAASSVTTLIESTDVPKLALTGGGEVFGGRTTSFVIFADQAPVQDTSISYSVVGSAQAGKDFEPITGTVLLKAGQYSVTVPLRTIPNVVFKPTDMIVGRWPIRIGQVSVKQGDPALPGKPLLSLTDTALTVRMRASATDRTKLKVGQKVTVTLQGGADEANGLISALDDTAKVDEKTGEQYYEGIVDVADLKAADGATVSLKVITDQRTDVLTVPIAAVKQNGSGKDTVRVLDVATGQVREVPVTTGLSKDSYMEIKTGLVGGEVVIVEVDKK